METVHKKIGGKTKPAIIETVSTQSKVYRPSIVVIDEAVEGPIDVLILSNSARKKDLISEYRHDMGSLIPGYLV